MNRTRLLIVSGLIAVIVGRYILIYVTAHMGAKILQYELEEFLADVY